MKVFIETPKEQAGLAGMQFLLDHPYGTLASSYCNTAPPETSFCALRGPAVNGVVLGEPRAEAETAACVGRVAEAGLDGLSEELVACSCERCGDAFDACLADQGCVDNMLCAQQYGCFGISCYQDHLCAPVIDQYGGPLEVSAQLAVAYSDCVGAAACDPCKMPPR